MMKFFIYPHIYCFALDNKQLLYNTKTGTRIETDSADCKELIDEIYKPVNLGMIELTEKQLQNNERVILDNLKKFYRGKTVVIVAHRLSTVQNADKIIVLDSSRIVEEGTHEELTGIKGAYYTLVKNQLELGA